MKPPAIGIASEVEVASSQVETETTFQRQQSRVHQPQDKSEDMDEFVVPLLVMLLMIVFSAIELTGRLRTAARWKRLMETAGFENWPQLRGSKLQLVACAISLAGSGLSSLALCCLPCTPRRATVRMATLVVLTNVIAACIDSVVVMKGSRGLANEAINHLASQVTPAATFNRGYCQAWCREKPAALVALLKGACGEDNATVFDQVVHQFDVGDWCKEAIAQQYYDVYADYNGTSPIAELKGGSQDSLASTSASDILSVLNGGFGLCLLYAWVTRKRTHS